MPSFPESWLHRWLPLFGRRLAVLDAGRQTLKILIAEASFQRVRVRHRQTVPLPAPGHGATEALRELLHATFPELHGVPLVILLPQHRAITQIVDLPRARPADVPVAIETEATRLSGLSDAAMRRAYVRLKPAAEYRNPHWLTLCKADEVEALIERYGHAFATEEEAKSLPPITDVVTSAQALLAAGTVIHPAPANAVFVELGANGTTIAIRAAGQAMFATSLPRGSGEFTATLVKSAGLDKEAAEARKHSTDLLAGEGTDPELAKAVERWFGDVKLVLSEWLEDHPMLGLSLAGLPVYLTGGGAQQPGLVTALNRLGNLHFILWPSPFGASSEAGDQEFVVAYGAALLGLGAVPLRVSLLPPDLAKARQRRRVWEGVQAGVLALLLATGGLLAWGTWQQSRLLATKQQTLRRTRNALALALEMDGLYRHLNLNYEQIRPVLIRQRQTVEALTALAAVERARTNDDFWFVSFADAVSYAAGTTQPEPATNRPVVSLTTSTSAVSLLAPARHEFITELCIPADGEVQRRILSQVVAELQQTSLFRRVDVLPPERKRNLVDPRVVLSNHVFAVSLQVTSEDLPPPIGLSSRSAALRDSRRSGPMAWPQPDTGATPPERIDEAP
jgi:Tfp pilus assembly PilM family ATPase